MEKMYCECIVLTLCSFVCVCSVYVYIFMCLHVFVCARGTHVEIYLWKARFEVICLPQSFQCLFLTGLPLNLELTGSGDWPASKLQISGSVPRCVLGFILSTWG